MPYIYLIHCRASINNGENVYKIGKTTDFNKRLDGYDKGSIPILSLYVNECDEFEKKLINIFDIKYKQRSDYGREYYEGEVNDMINQILQEFNNKNLCYKIDKKEEKIDMTIDNIMKLKTKLRNKLNKININNINSFQTGLMMYSIELNDNQYYHYINNYISNYRSNNTLSLNSKKCKFGDYLENNYSFINNLCHSVNLNSNNLKLIEKINLLT